MYELSLVKKNFTGRARPFRLGKGMLPGNGGGEGVNMEGEHMDHMDPPTSQSAGLKKNLGMCLLIRNIKKKWLT